MGNASAGATGGWFSFGDEGTVVSLRLNDARNVGLKPGEELCGIVSLGPDTPSATSLRFNTRAAAVVSAETTIVLEFRAVPAGGTLEGRTVGEVRLPLEHVAKRCGHCLYYTWFPLNAPWPRKAQGGSGPSAGGQAGQGDTLEHFDRALRNAARDPRWPMVCLGLCRADSPEAEVEVYQLSTAATEKTNRFRGVMQSQVQHARLFQALYRQCRAAQQAKPELREFAGTDDWANPLDASAAHVVRSKRNSRTTSADITVSGINEVQTMASPAHTAPAASELSRLRYEIDSTTAEANNRINQANDAIRTLKERVTAKQAEHGKLRHEVEFFNHEAEMLEVENERLALQLERRAREGVADTESPAEEARRLRLEADTLRKQKEALLLILEDLSNAAPAKSEEPPPSPKQQQQQQQPQPQPQPALLRTHQAELSTHTASHGQADVNVAAGYPVAAGMSPPPPLAPAAPVAPVAVSEEEQQTWENLLPRPSELFDSVAFRDSVRFSQ